MYITKLAAFYFAPIDGQSIVISLSVCLLTFLKNHMFKSRQISYTRFL